MKESATVPEERICRLPEVEQMTGLRASRIYDLMAESRFPRNFKLAPGGRASGWLRSEILDYVAARVAERDAISGQAA